MVAPTHGIAPVPVNAFMLAQRGVPVIVTYQGEGGEVVRERITDEPELRALVARLDGACHAAERSQWRAIVRLGAALNQIRTQLRHGQAGGVYAYFGINPRRGQHAMLLARKVADAEGRIDESRLTAAIVELRRRDRAEKSEEALVESTAGTAVAPERTPATPPTIGEKRGALRISPEQGDGQSPARVLASASLREVERAARAMSVGPRVLAQETNESEAGQVLVSPLLVRPGRAETPVRAFRDRTTADTAVAPNPRWTAGEQRGMDELYAAAADVAERCRAVAALSQGELAGRLEAMGTDELEVLIGALASLGG